MRSRRFLRGIARAVVLGLPLALGQAAQAQDFASLVDASATITGLSIRLVDLKPDDGIAPWIVFSGPSDVPGSLMSYRVDAEGQVNGMGEDLETTYPNAAWVFGDTFLPSAPVSALSKDGMASGSIGPTGADVGLHVRSDALDHLTPVWTWQPAPGSTATELTANSYARTGSAATTNYVQNWEVLPDGSVQVFLQDPELIAYDFTLSPDTTLIVEGVSSSSLAVRPDLVPWLDPLAENWASANTLAALQFAAPQFAMQSSYVSLEAFRADLDRLYGFQSVSVRSDWSPFWEGSMPYSDTRSQAWQLTLDNHSSEASQGALQISAMAYAHFVNPSTVPEPSTYAFMGLGLIAIAGLVRRRDRQG
jgi:hypothetical protein